MKALCCGERKRKGKGYEGAKGAWFSYFSFWAHGSEKRGGKGEWGRRVNFHCFAWFLILLFTKEVFVLAGSAGWKEGRGGCGVVYPVRRKKGFFMICSSSAF